MAKHIPRNPSHHEVLQDTTCTYSIEVPLSSKAKWYFTKEEIEEHSPSRKDGIDHEYESHLRQLYCSYMQELGIELKVPQVTIATAMMLCHRFYMRQSHAKNHWQTVSNASMFLACKAEDTPRWLKDLVVVAYKLMYRWDPLAPHKIRQKEVYDKQKELIFSGEQLILVTIAFDLNIEHPYKPLVAALKMLEISDKEVVKVAWNFVNDWLRTTMCLQYKPHYIAAGSIYLAAKLKKIKLPSAKGKAWWLQFDVSPKQLEEVIQHMLRLIGQSTTQATPASSEANGKLKPVAGNRKSGGSELCVSSGLTSQQDSRNSTIQVTSASSEANGKLKPVAGKRKPGGAELCVSSGLTTQQDSRNSTKQVTSASSEANGRLKPVAGKRKPGGAELCVSSGLTSQQDSRNSTVVTAEMISEPTVVKCNQKQQPNNDANDIVHLTKNCPSETSSANSVVEDCDAEQIIEDTNDKIGCKIFSVKERCQKIDIAKIKEKLKRVKMERAENKNPGDNLEDVMSGEDWIERELEKGIQSVSALS